MKITPFIVNCAASVGILLSTSITALAVCPDNSQHCRDEQVLRDDEIWEAYNYAFDTAEGAYYFWMQEYLDQLNETKSELLSNLHDKIGDPSIPNDVGTCDDAATSAMEQPNSGYATAQSDCQAAHPGNQNDYQACICAPEAEHNYSGAAAQAGLTRCEADANTDYSYGSSIADTDYSVDSEKVRANFWYTAGEADADLRQTLALSEYFTLLCVLSENVFTANCTLLEDCQAHPSNCCADSCAIADNIATFNITADFFEAVVPADAERTHKVLMCGVTQTRDDILRYADYIENYGYGAAKYNKDTSKAGSEKAYSNSMAEHLFAKEDALCLCAYPNQQEEYED